jgi:hypothetical protein
MGFDIDSCAGTIDLLLSKLTFAVGFDGVNVWAHPRAIRGTKFCGYWFLFRIQLELKIIPILQNF